MSDKFKFSEEEKGQILNAFKAWYDSKIGTLSFCDDFIASIESIISECDGWIDVKDKPAPYQQVLVAFGQNEAQAAYLTAYWCGDSWILNGNPPILTKTVTHWQPLPSPPKQPTK